MLQFAYVGDSLRVFPDFGFEVAPGDVVEHHENPDPNFFEPVEAADAAAPQES